MQLKIDNEFKALIPPLSDDEYNGLRENIKENGCRTPIDIWGDIIIDGHNRYEICTKFNIPFETKSINFPERIDAEIWIINNQLDRRNLVPFTRTKLAVQKKDRLAIKGKQAISEAVSKSNKERAKDENTIEIFKNPTLQNSAKLELPNPIPKPKIDTRAEMAKLANVSHDTVSKVEKILKVADQTTIKALDTGEKSINEVFQQIKKEEKKEIVKQKVDEYKEAIKEENNFRIDIYTTDKKYNIIYADPPWQYWESGAKNQSNHYTTMTLSEIKALPIQKIADDNCILFLWVTFPILKESFEVMESWGFKYSTCGFNWVKRTKNDKVHFGNGAWTRANSELCLIGSKGSITRLDASISQVIEEPISEHSRKPCVVREKITQLVGELPRIELFARESAKNWYFWGNEI